MRRLAKSVIRTALNRSSVRSFTESVFMRAAGFMRVELDKHRPPEGSPFPTYLQEISERAFPDMIISSGPFKDMRYARYVGVESAMSPKFVGSYEDELHPFIDEAISRKFKNIVNVGCAEGYYAVGLAMRIPEAQVYAYDILTDARKLCEELAELNGVSDRVHIRELCDSEELKKFSDFEDVLVICDCEGYEYQLFDREVAKALSKATLLIEMHEMFEPRALDKVSEAFAETHSIEKVYSLDCREKFRRNDYSHLHGVTDLEKYLLVYEWRPPMEWWILRPV